jgi:putative membrane-bound dehydrogenase-like protein
MHGFPERFGLAVLGVAFLCLLLCPGWAAESPETNAVARPRPATTNAPAGFLLPPGFRLELVAAEPLIAAPVAIAFDENGRLFVAEAGGNAGQRGTNASSGRVRLLEDTEGTGEFHVSTIYADKLPSASALACSSGGVFVATGPEICFFKDSRTNGIADVRRVAFTILAGTNTPSAPARPNNFNWGMDNRIHAASAGAASGVIAPRVSGAASIALDRAFSFDPRALTVTSDGIPAQSGLAFDNGGRALVCDFKLPLRLPSYPARYRERNPFFLPLPEAVDVLSPATAVFRLGAPASLPAGLTNAQSAGVPSASVVTAWLTNAQGCTIYRGNAFPSNYLGNAFIADPSAHIVHRAVLREAGLQVAASRAADEAHSEFLMSTDPSFRPVQVVNGPEGALYVVDAQDGRERGRIYRIVPEGFTPGKLPRLGKARTYDLVAILSHPNGWHRDTAARLLYERRDPAAAGPLTSLLSSSRVPLARLQALHALDGLGALRPANLLGALRDTDARVREHAVLLSEKQARGGLLPDALWSQLRPLTADPSPRVRYQLALTLGEFRQPGSAGVLAELLWQTSENSWMEAAAFSSLANGAGEVFRFLLPQARGNAEAQELQLRVATMIGVRAQRQEVAQVVGLLAQAPLESQQALPLVVALGQGLRQGGSSLGRMDPQGLLARFYSDAANLLFSSAAAEPARIAGIELLSVSPSTFADNGDLLLLPLNSGQSDAIQSAAIATLGSYDDPRVAPALLRRWGTLKPQLRRAMLTALLGRTGRAAFVLDALENGSIDRAEVTSLEANLLRTDADPAVAGRAARLLGPLSLKRPATVQRFKAALTLKGVAASGREAFVARCAACHQPSGARPTFGPELSTAKIYGKEWAFNAILEPGLAASLGYETCVLQTGGGDILWGILRDGNASTVTLQQLNGTCVVLRRSNIPYLQPRPWSLMPDTVAEGLTPQELADLLEYLVAAPR